MRRCEVTREVSHTTNVPSLNEYQLRALLASCHHMDKLLTDIEDILGAPESKSVFPKYIDDLSPIQHRTIQDYIRQLRAQLLRVVAAQGIEPEKPKIAASHAVHATVTFVEIAIAELRPEKMRGYGQVSETARSDLNGLVQELHSSAQQLHRYVLEKQAPDLKQRLAALKQRGGQVEMLRRIEEIVTRRGLIEFRPTLTTLLDSLEEDSFEIAFFGHVNSGKSSLLNRLIEADILPVGVTPITAVPTRVSYGSEPQLAVWLEGRGRETAGLDRLPEFADERLNPGNSKRVAKISVAYPSPQLRQGIVLVDTPGIGSVMTKGTAEVMAYLPRCDAAFVLIDAASTLAPDDMNLIQALLNSSIPVHIAISKADLLPDADLWRVEDYVHGCVREALGVDVPVRPVSTLPSHILMLHQWAEKDVSTLYGNHQELRAESITRKVLRLREGVCAALRAKLESCSDDEGRRAELEGAENRLRHIAGKLQVFRSELRKWTDQLRESAQAVIHKTAEFTAQRLQTETEIDIGDLLCRTATDSALDVSRNVHDHMSELARSLRTELAETALAAKFADIPSEEEFAPRGEMPLFHLNRSERWFGSGKLLHVLGPGVEANRAERELQALRPALETAVQSYAVVLNGWAERALQELEEVFESYAGRYRAAIIHLLGAGASEEDPDSLRKDIEALSELPAGTVRVV